MELKIHELIELENRYGASTTIRQLREIIQGSAVYQCPKCKGKGTVRIKYNAYPSGLPDSGFVEDWQYKDIKCDLCEGEGYTEVEYVPKYVQDGYEIKKRANNEKT